jgi:DNA-directed RNA polymerase I, II, and III subunit RPABC3
VAQSEGYGMPLTLDINCELFPLKAAQKFSLMLAKSLDQEVDSTVGPASSGAVPFKAVGGGTSSLADMYDYVMFGKVYKLESLSNDKM